MATDPAPTENDDFAYECPDCGEGHDGMTTGTELCPNCQDDADNRRREGVKA